MDLRKMRVVKLWHRLPKEVADTSCLQIFKVRLGGAWNNLV